MTNLKSDSKIHALSAIPMNCSSKPNILLTRGSQNMLYAGYQFAKDQNTPDTVNPFPDNLKGPAEHSRVAVEGLWA